MTSFPNKPGTQINIRDVRNNVLVSDEKVFQTDATTFQMQLMHNFVADGGSRAEHNQK